MITPSQPKDGVCSAYPLTRKPKDEMHCVTCSPHKEIHWPYRHVVERLEREQSDLETLRAENLRLKTAIEKHQAQWHNPDLGCLAECMHLCKTLI